MSSMSCVIFKSPWICLQPWTCTVHGLRRNILRCVPICLFRGTFRNFLGKTLPQLLEKWFPLQGERAHSQTPISIQIKSESNPIHFLLFFLPLSPGQPELCGSYHLLQSCFSFFVRLHGQPFGSYHLLQSCFSFFVRLHDQPEPFVAASFSSLALFCSSVSTANLSGLLVTTFSSLSFLSNSFSSPFNLLGVARHCFSWSSVSDDFSFWLSFLLYLFCVLSSAFLSSVLHLKLCLL